ncbi:MAG: hypothetical protein BMS9Abin30_0930 [Gammaproteobacteria bacterium]|nr:MAG: hypothetical protein BMS9Abin30_0930 [Gammaproteobacteria bacterium]
MKINITASIKKKILAKHGVTEKEVKECFANRDRFALRDEREDHQTDPPSCWIIAETNHLRELKVVFVVKDGVPAVKTAYEPNPEEVRIYNSKARLLD